MRPKNSKIEHIVKEAEKNGTSEELKKTLSETDFRLIMDVRMLNKHIKNTNNTSVYIRDIVNAFKDFTCVTTMDIAKGYPSIPVHANSKNKLAFRFKNKSYSFNYMVEGLCNAPNFFQSIMAQALTKTMNYRFVREHNAANSWQFYGGKMFDEEDPPLPNHLKNDNPVDEKQKMDEIIKLMETSFAMIYMDDLFLISRERDPEIRRENHKALCRQVFEDLRNAGMLIAPGKLIFCKTDKVQCLGYIINPRGYEPITDRMEVFLNAPLPATKKQLYSAIGCFSYLQNFSPNTNVLLGPLYDLLAKTETMRSPVPWTEEDVKVFRQMCTIMSDVSQLYFYNPTKTLYISSDASAVGAGGCVSQECGNGKRNVVLYWSKKFSPEIQKNTSSMEKEILSVIYALTSPNVNYFINQALAPIIIENDASSCIALCANVQAGIPKACRWAAKISSLPGDIRFKHTPNSTFYHLPDALSRSFPETEEKQRIERLPLKHVDKDQVIIPKSIAEKENYTFDDVDRELMKNPTIVDNIKKMEEENIKLPKRIRKDKITPEIPIPAAVFELSDETTSTSSTKSTEQNIKITQPTGQLFNVLMDFNCENLLKMQLSDPEIRKIMDKVLKTNSKQYPRYKVLNAGLLCRLKSKKIKNPTIRDYQICLNEETACNILALIHSLTHAGQNTTIKMFKRFYYSQST